MGKLIIFDVDGTLTPYMREVRFPDHVVAKLVSLRAQDAQLALAANQGGVGYRFWVESAGGFGATPEEKAESLAKVATFPTAASAWQRLSTIAGEVTALTLKSCRIYCCYAYLSSKGNWGPTPDTMTHAEAAAWAYNDKDPQWVGSDPMWSKEWRKPSPGMLVQAAQDAGVDIADCLFVGDMETDQQAALACNMPYMDQKEFFA